MKRKPARKYSKKGKARLENNASDSDDNSEITKAESNYSPNFTLTHLDEAESLQSQISEQISQHMSSPSDNVKDCEDKGEDTLKEEDGDARVQVGYFVIWEGSPTEPVFKRSGGKAGRFYIVNCGDSKNIGHFKTSDVFNAAAAASNQLSSCSCCAFGCPTNSIPASSTTSQIGILTGETGKRVSRRRSKGPKKVQLVTKEEHHKILSSYIEHKRSREGDAMKESCDSNLTWLLDFKVDSLFPHQVDPGAESNNHLPSSSSLSLTENLPSRRTRLQKRMTPGKHCGIRQRSQQHHNCTSQHHLRLLPHHQNQQCEIENVICDSLERGIDDDSLVSFTVNRNPEIVDDVAGYEMVESQVTSSDIVEQSMEDSGIGPSDFGMSMSHEDGDASMDGSSNEQRQKRTYRMRKTSDKETDGEIICDHTGKPRCTYTDLIEKALRQSNGGLTVSEIYNWISTHYPYFQANDDRWKNSVRHNLSINPYFKKGDKARNGAGHLWVISEEGKGIRPPIRRKSGPDGLMDAVCIDNNIIPIRNETDRAISVILSEYAVASMQHQNPQTHRQENGSPVTYIELPDDMTIGTGNGESGHQVLCYEDLPQAQYTIDVHENGINGDQMYTLTDFNPAELIIINQDEANKENMSGEMLEDMIVSDFSVLHQNQDGTMVNTGRMSAPPQEMTTSYQSSVKRDRVLNRSSSLPIQQSHHTHELNLDTNTGPAEINGEDCASELTMLTNMTTMSNGDHPVTMESIGTVAAPLHQQDTQVIEIIGGDHLFDAKELGMVYEYDHHGDPLFL